MVISVTFVKGSNCPLRAKVLPSLTFPWNGDRVYDSGEPPRDGAQPLGTVVAPGPGSQRDYPTPPGPVVGFISDVQESRMPSIMRRFIDWNRRVSRWERSVATRLVPESGPDGPVDFRDNVLPGLLAPGLRILDVGGGKYPAISPATKRELGLHVVGLDISAEELAQVAPGAYDSVIVGDVSRVEIPEQFDLVFSRTLLEHVADTPAAIA